MFDAICIMITVDPPVSQRVGPDRLRCVVTATKFGDGVIPDPRLGDQSKKYSLPFMENMGK